MRNLKKFLALVLAMVMAMSLMVTANAATTNKIWPDDSDADPAFDEAIKVLSGMDVYQGDGANFYPARTITRAEVAKLIYRLVSGDTAGVQEGLYAKYGNFPDVTEDKWYAGAVGYCANAGLIKGRADGTFDPSGNVTGYEVLAMILRAVGYDKNGEFTGSNWQVEVSSLSQQLGVLANVKTTQYGGNLHLAARRDVVADLLFQTVAYVPQVNYTTAFGYQQYGNEGGVVGSVKNQTLGQKVFGLTSNIGVIVGNESTGEAKSVTKIGFSLDSKTTNSAVVGNIPVAGGGGGPTPANGVIYSSQTTFTTAIDDTMAIRQVYNIDNIETRTPNAVASAYHYESDTTSVLPGNVTRSFKWDTTIRDFNHAVKVWYDYRGNSYETVGNGINGTVRFTTDLTTYAMFDKSTNVAVVSAVDADIAATQANVDTNNLYKVATAKSATAASVINNWTAPGFVLRTGDANKDGDIDPTEYAAYFNYAFTRMGSANYGDDAAGSASAESPVLKNAGGLGGAEKWPLYLLISNSPNKELDVVITLDMTFSQVVQANNTRAPYSTGVTNENGGADYFDTFDIPGSGTMTYTEIAQDNMVEKDGSEKTLGKKIAAIEITGTNGGRVVNADRIAATTGSPNQAGELAFGFANEKSPLTSTYYYKLEENKIHKTATVVRIDTANQDVHLSDGSVLHQSVFAESVDGTYSAQMEGVNKDFTDSLSWTMQLQAGRTYTFTLDEAGNYIYWETPSNTSNFVYGTYIDFTSDVASSSFSYPLVHVKADGTTDKTDIKKVVDNFSDDNNNTSPLEKLNGTMNSYLYSHIQLNKRDSSVTGIANPVTAGYMKGSYVGYALDSSGNLKAVGPYGQTNPDGSSADQDTGFWQGSDSDFGAATWYDSAMTEHNGIRITAKDATIGAKQVPFAGTTSVGNVELFLTENTQFYIVDGAGTANLKVTPYKGVSELLEGCDSVIIDAKTDISGAKYLENTNTTFGSKAYEMVYYSLGRFEYAQNYVGSAEEVATVFIPAELVTFNKSSETTLAFIGDSDATLISSVGPHATRFTFYQNAEARDYWISGYTTDTTDTPAKIIAQNGDDVFYNLIPTGDTAADGQPIYTIRNVTSPATKVIGRAYNGWDGTTYTASYVDVNVTSTPMRAEYAATVYNQQVAYIDSADNFPNNGTAVSADLWNVGSAKIKNLNTVKYPGILDNNLTTLNQAGSLTDNERVLVSCVLDTSDRQGVTVSIVYVNFDQDDRTP